MFIKLMEKLCNAFGRNKPKGAACIAANEFQKVRFHDLDHLSGSWVADSAFDEVVKAFDLIDQPRVS